eukprot:7957625-Alexandrium_andersonii.AAC.1
MAPPAQGVLQGQHAEQQPPLAALKGMDAPAGRVDKALRFRSSGHQAHHHVRNQVDPDDALRRAEALAELKDQVHENAGREAQQADEVAEVARIVSDVPDAPRHAPPEAGN